MKKPGAESVGTARPRPVRGLRDIRTLGGLRRPTPPASTAPPAPAGAALVDVRLGIGLGKRGTRPADRPPERPRAWVFVKRPGFARYQGALAVDQLVEPDVEIFEEGRDVVVLAELPGVAKEEIEVQVNGDVLTLATKPTHPGRRRYYRELVLPFPASAAGLSWGFRNGVLELEVSRAESPGAARRKTS
ncbi:MAG: Hsp20/alpha crystallin family protein [Deltaproteobacteria bacterium]|nr:Hsp20/alpha crystallin family protein [Deltaproteobacteria bacterium]